MVNNLEFMPCNTTERVKNLIYTVAQVCVVLFVDKVTILCYIGSHVPVLFNLSLITCCS